MPDYKCLICGYVKSDVDEKTDQSNEEKVISCPECGDRMFPMPFVRREKLLQIIRKSVNQATCPALEDELFEPSEYRKDLKKFPDFETIREYICKVGKTEEFFERIRQSMERIVKYNHSKVQKQYELTNEKVLAFVTEREKSLRQFAGIVDQSCEFDALILPKITLNYSATPDEDLFFNEEDLTMQINRLIEKIRKYIVSNALYGLKPADKFGGKLPDAEEGPATSMYRSALRYLGTIIGKRYEPDVLSDGKTELREMMDCLWFAFRTLREAPILKTDVIYHVIFEGEATVEKLTAKELKALLESRIITHFHPFRKVEDELTLFAEKKLVEVYKRLDDWENGFDVDSIGEGAEESLRKLVGLRSVKESIRKIKAYSKANKDAPNLNIHMCFRGNPGTGKTQVARIIAGILYENDILPENKVIEVDRSGLVAEYVGQTAIKTMQKIREAMGGVLFIDEAYSLIPGDGLSADYGQEAVATLLKAMEDYRGKLCVILAGYSNEMERMLTSNPGFKSRIQFMLDFPNYNREELGQILDHMLSSFGYTMNEQTRERMLDITDVKRKSANFANAREVRSMLEQVIMCQNVRTEGQGNREIGMADVNRYIEDNRLVLNRTSDHRIMSAEEELAQLIGLSGVKRMIRKVNAYAKKNGNDGAFQTHMCFMGNPGTGKTEVARILSRLLYESGVLPEAKMVETDASGLVGKYIGETAPKTHAKIQEAMGGVLFIDEAYALCQTDGQQGSFGDEAIAALLKDMEDYRGKFCVILAGYRNEMAELLESNPGFKSRFQFMLEFPDYTSEELGDIAAMLLKKKDYEVTTDAMTRIMDVMEYMRTRPSFANARTLRNVLDQVVMNQNLRTEDEDEDFIIVLDDVEDYIADERLFMETPGRHIGFQ